MAVRAIQKSGTTAVVVVARNSEEALNYVFSRGEFEGRISPDPDFILVDVKLGAISGLDLLRILRGDTRSRVIPVVMLSGSLDETVIHDCFVAGANSYLVKPVDMDEYMDMFRTATHYWLNLNRTLEAPTQQIQRYLS